MNYIGSKLKLLPFIDKTIQSIVKEDLANLIFCDLFAGTGIVGSYYKNKVKKVLANDFEFYSYVIIRNSIQNSVLIKNSTLFIDKLNNLAPKEGFIYKNYCLGGHGDRQYFSDENGKIIDASRQQIEIWKQNNTINEDLYFFLLASLLESADKLANTASVYGAYLKHLKKSAQKKLVISPATYKTSINKHFVYNEDSNQLIKTIKGDILYLDPPYNARQYGSNYHILNTIAIYDTFIPKGKTGLREYQKSKYCSNRTVENTFEDLIKHANFKYIILSYNNEGLLSVNQVKTIMEKYGKYQLITTKYQRYRADKKENRNHKANQTEEYLHILVKS